MKLKTHSGTGARLVELETTQCFSCNGIGIYTPHLPCPSNGAPQRGRPCPTCGAKTRQHNYVAQPSRMCGACKGSGYVPETETSTVPPELLDTIPIAVQQRRDRHQSWAEQHLGLGIYSCVDYGRHHNNTDEEIATEVRKSLNSHTQLCKLIRPDTKVLCDRILVMGGSTGYVVLPVWDN